jgi:hypothetical protein
MALVLKPSYSGKQWRDNTMVKKTSDSLLQRNEEYVKLRTQREPGEKSTPREQPSQQMPGNKGHDRAQYAHWINEELRDTARKLNILDADSLEREGLIDALLEAEDSRSMRS